ncbi:YusW family protein [Paenibacillus silvisoli]|uniref:YusW family protein n=1 Tax=Paenibacillus silvisoli TaxID=3110539 RepID=UPI0028046FC6|nr:YusW family protein [Paenibacillus silvisoli]
MKKKIAYIMIGAMCTLVLSYGVVAFADQADTSEKDAAAPKSVTVTTTAQSQQLNELIEKFTKATDSSVNGTFKLDQIKEMEIELKGSHLKLKIELEKEEEAVKYEVEIEQKDEKEVHLKGDKAKQFITQLLAAIGLNESMSKQQFVDALYKKLAVEPAQAVTTLELKWKSDDDKEVKKSEEIKKAQAAQEIKAKQALLEQKAKQAQQAKAAQEAQKKAKAEQKAKAAAEKKEQKLQKALKKQNEKLSKKQGLKNGKCDNGRDDDDQGEDHDDDDDHGRDNEGKNTRHHEHDDDHEDRNRS